MGAGKGGGYVQKESLTGTGQQTLEQLLQQALQSLSGQGGLSQNPLYNQSVEATRQFLPGGEGFNPIQAEAQRNFQQQTIPSILNAFGTGSKGSSALNQALAGAGQNLNTSLASQLAQMQLGAAQQGSQLAQQPYQQGLQSAGLGLNTSPFAYMQRPRPFWQDLTLAGITGAADITKSAVGK